MLSCIIAKLGIILVSVMSSFATTVGSTRQLLCKHQRAITSFLSSYFTIHGLIKRHINIFLRFTCNTINCSTLFNKCWALFYLLQRNLVLNNILRIYCNYMWQHNYTVYLKLHIILQEPLSNLINTAPYNRSSVKCEHFKNIISTKFVSKNISFIKKTLLDLNPNQLKLWS